MLARRKASQLQEPGLLAGPAVCQAAAVAALPEPRLTRCLPHPLRLAVVVRQLAAPSQLQQVAEVAERSACCGPAAADVRLVAPHCQGSES